MNVRFKPLKLFRRLASSRPGPSKSPRSSRPMLQQLEDRRLLSGNVQFQLFGSIDLQSYAGVGFQENQVGSMTVSVNGQPDPKKGDFQAQIHWGDGTSSQGVLIYEGSDPAGAQYLIKGSHVYQKAGDDFPVTFTVTGPYDSSATLEPDNMDSAEVWSMPSGIPGTQPPATANPTAPSNVVIQLQGSLGLTSYAGVGFEENQVATIQVLVNGQPDKTLSDFHAQINWGDSASWTSGDLVYQSSDAGGAIYLIKGSHVYQNAVPNIPVVVYVTGPDGTSASLIPSEVNSSQVWAMPGSFPGTQPPSTPKSMPPANVQINLAGSYGLTFTAGVGLQENDVGNMTVSVNGEADPNLSDFHAQINWGDSASWTSGDLVYQGSDGGGAHYLIEGIHVYQKPGEHIPIVVYVTGPDGTSASLSPSDLDYADVAPNPNGLSLGSLAPTQWNANETGYHGTIAVSGGSGGYKDLEVKGLPQGLSAGISSSTLNGHQSGTITISGTPTQIGTFPLQVSLEDGKGHPLDGTYSLAIGYTSAAGYVAETNAANPASGAVTKVSGSWTVPTVSGISGAQAAVWVGMDGYTAGSNTIEQIGTTGYVQPNGKVIYQAWYEMYPAGLVEITPAQLSISHGDKISASVTYDPPTSKTPGSISMMIMDNSTGKSFPVGPFTVSSAIQRSSAEWVVEDPQDPSGTYPYGLYPLANFGTVTFSSASATINGVSGPINDPSWQSQSIDIVSSGGTIEATTSALTTTGEGSAATNGFTVTYRP